MVSILLISTQIEKIKVEDQLNWKQISVSYNDLIWCNPED